ncbi:hypothetical protein TNCV_4734621 [Trichonephila clavipes]|nr:hypothetical protein TNCV_4734621 [Trichonephila clavipes]
MATGSYLTPNYSHSQSEIQGDLHKLYKKEVVDDRLTTIPAQCHEASGWYIKQSTFHNGFANSTSKYHRSVTSKEVERSTRHRGRSDAIIRRCCQELVNYGCAECQEGSNELRAMQNTRTE